MEENRFKRPFTVFMKLLYLFTFFYMLFIKKYPIHYLLTVYLIITCGIVFLFYDSILGFIGNYFFATGKKEKSAKYLKKAIDRNTTQPTVYLNYAIGLLKEGNAKEALIYLQKANKINNKILIDKNILLSIGSCYMVMGDTKKAIEVLTELMEKYDYVNAHVLTTLGYAYFLENDLDTALSLTEQSIEEDPANGASWDNMGQIYYKKGDIDQAILYFEKALQINHDLADSNYYLSVIYEKKGDEEKALHYLNKASSCHISALNTITEKQIKDKCELYAKNGVC